ncbi:hypothetical protein HNY73_022813 [Argiope bruennichi]|uniref:Uncharacterized protein n=1 Tax=Argiope bruennichi TaxID=94029 RepID=A0A8T0E3J1_ARGBR|nr:hypothetical protein HNY73_022813 [Argiope bruennichi]
MSPSPKKQTNFCHISVYTIRKVTRDRVHALRHSTPAFVQKRHLNRREFYPPYGRDGSSSFGDSTEGGEQIGVPSGCVTNPELRRF